MNFHVAAGSVFLEKKKNNISTRITEDAPYGEVGRTRGRDWLVFALRHPF